MSCRCTHISTPAPACNAGCIVGGYYVVYPNDSVGNCGQVGTIDLTSLPVNVRNNTICGGQVIFKIDAYDTTNFEWVSLSNNIISYSFKTTALRTGCYKIRGKVICPATGNGEFFEITVCVKDLCATASCNSGEECDPCTGNCIEAEADISTE